MQRSNVLKLMIWICATTLFIVSLNGTANTSDRSSMKKAQAVFGTLE